jgi:hypothetical protein
LQFLLSEWVNSSVNAWTLQLEYLPINVGQAQYILSDEIIDVVQSNLRTSLRQLNGSPASSNSGVAANAFDGNPATTCTQDAANGNISYDYGLGQSQIISFFGLQSNTTILYSLVVEISQDDATWTTLFAIPPQTFTAGLLTFFDVPVLTPARAYRIRETGGATLDIQEIYFNNLIRDLPMAQVSRYEYLLYPNKQQAGRPVIYYLNKQLTPILNIYPVPSNLYNCIQLSYKQVIQDLGSLINMADIPSAFYQAMVWGLSWHLAIKFNPQAASMFQVEYEKSLHMAQIENAEETTISIGIDYNASNCQ